MDFSQPATVNTAHPIQGETLAVLHSSITFDMRSWLRAAALCVALPFTYAQFPKEPTGVTVLESRFGEGVKISYKEVRTKYTEQRNADETILAWHLRDHTRRQVVCWLHPLTAWHA